MDKKFLSQMLVEPYRLFFPLGVLYVLWGALVWLPLIWSMGEYPVLAHRYLMLNGFAGSFIGGFLMTAVPKFSKTKSARKFELIIFFLVTVGGIVLAYLKYEEGVAVASCLQALTILFFIFTRIRERKENPPYSFVFLFVGLFLWFLSGGLSVFAPSEALTRLHYEGAIAAIIFGVGSRLIPGILGHVEIVAAQRILYERPVSIFSTVPKIFLTLILSFAVSYFLPETLGAFLRSSVAGIIGFKYWLLWKAPKDRTALTWSIWCAAWFIVLSFILRAVWVDGMIHAGHSFFITGIVLLSLLVATRVLQSHGPKDKRLENSPVLYVVSILLVLAAATRISAYLMPDHYLAHLGYSALVLVLAVILWSIRYLRYCVTF